MMADSLRLKEDKQHWLSNGGMTAPSGYYGRQIMCGSLMNKSSVLGD